MTLTLLCRTAKPGRSWREGSCDLCPQIGRLDRVMRVTRRRLFPCDLLTATGPASSCCADSVLWMLCSPESGSCL